MLNERHTATTAVNVSLKLSNSKRMKRSAELQTSIFVTHHTYYNYYWTNHNSHVQNLQLHSQTEKLDTVSITNDNKLFSNAFLSFCISLRTPDTRYRPTSFMPTISHSHAPISSTHCSGRTQQYMQRADNSSYLLSTLPNKYNTTSHKQSKISECAENLVSTTKHLWRHVSTRNNICKHSTRLSDRTCQLCC